VLLCLVGCVSDSGVVGDGGAGDGGDGGVGAGGDAAGGGDGGGAVDGSSVLELHKHANRDGLYADPAFTAAAAKQIHLDAQFDGKYAQAGSQGPVYAQPLFVDGGGAGDFLIVATEDNYVLALDATTGKLKWKTPPSAIGAPARSGDFSCGNVDPSGVTGTPVVDLPSRTLFFQADVVKGGAMHHLIYAVSIDDGSVRAGWPYDVGTLLPNFGAGQTGERGALTILGGNVYVPFGGRYGDCTPYRGYVVGLPMTNPQGAFYFQTKVQDGSGGGAGGGIWSPAGISSDGTNLYVVTGNAQGTFPTDWKSSYTNGVFGLPPTLAFDPNDTAHYFAPTDWHPLDQSDTDLSGSGVQLVDLPGTSTPHLAVVLGKDSKAYLLDRGGLGGIGGALFSAVVAGGEIINVPASYSTAQGTYVAFRAVCPSGGQATLNAIKISAGPTATNVWCANVPGGGSPIVTTAGSDTIVWFVSAEGEGVTPDYKVHGFDGDTGKEVATSAALTPTHRFVSPIVAKGRMYIAADAQLHALAVP